MKACPNSQKFCAREDDASKANLDLHKNNDVKDDFVRTNDLATRCRRDEKRGREDEATADLDLHSLKKVKGNANTYANKANKIDVNDNHKSNYKYLHIFEPKPFVRHIKNRQISSDHFEIKYVGDHHEPWWQNKKLLSIDVASEKVIKFYQNLDNKPSTYVVNSDYSDSEGSYMKDVGPVTSFVPDKQKIVMFLSALKHNFIFDIGFKVRNFNNTINYLDNLKLCRCPCGMNEWIEALKKCNIYLPLFESHST